MDDHLLLFLVLFPLLSVGGVALIVIGLSGIRKARRQEERERSRASGTVVDIVKHLSLGRGKPLIAWHPVVEFRAEGQLLRHESCEGYWPAQIRVGDHVEILYDADDPSHYHMEEGPEKQAAGCRVTVLVGMLWIAVASIVALFVSR